LPGYEKFLIIGKRYTRGLFPVTERSIKNAYFLVSQRFNGVKDDPSHLSWLSSLNIVLLYKGFFYIRSGKQRDFPSNSSGESSLIIIIIILKQLCQEVKNSYSPV